MNDKKAKLGTEPYKGVRDFYPEDMAVQNYIFGIMRKTVESFGYSEYNASILEPTELYTAKSGEEIVNEQTYSFRDRGDREVTLRPEMTPTVTRMVAAKRKELSFPLRWYSIPNLFRYEKPQRGRLREHFQLNVDLFGIEDIHAEIEAISVAHSLMLNFGATENDFIIKINSRKILNYLLQEVFTLTDEKTHTLTKLIDKKNKIPADVFKDESQKILDKHTDDFVALMNAKTISEFIEIADKKTSSEILGAKEVKELLEKLADSGIRNAQFDPTIARGFDYYTGVVFEVFDTNPENPRAVFGGGRYDDLLSVFGSDKVPSVGFGMGDVTTKDFLETHGILPKYASKTMLAICNVTKDVIPFTTKLAQNLRKENINVSVDLTSRKIGDQIKWASKNSIPYVLCIGENEIKNSTFSIKELISGKDTVFSSEKEIIDFLRK